MSGCLAAFSEEEAWTESSIESSQYVFLFTFSERNQFWTQVEILRFVCEMEILDWIKKKFIFLRLNAIKIEKFMKTLRVVYKKTL